MEIYKKLDKTQKRIRELNKISEEFINRICILAMKKWAVK